MKFIVCPNCGYEYHSAEIFVPSAIIGKPVGIERDNNGKITKVISDNVNFKETYQCDKCNKHFSIVANIDYEVISDSNVDFDTDYETLK